LLFIIFLLEAPSIPLSLAKNQLKEQGISYSSIDGGVFSGINLTDVNYQDQIRVKNLNLKVDWRKLEERVLYIEDIKIEGIEIDKEYLASLVDSNSSDENGTESNITLPFDRVVLKEADISLKDIVYGAYRVNSAKLKVRDLTTDMREQYRGDIKLTLDSNVTQIELDGSVKNGFVKFLADIEAEREFINPFVANKSISLTKNPILTLKADGNITEVNYHVDIHQLALKQNRYRVDSKKLILFGRYNIPKKDVKATLKTELKGSMAYLKLDGDAELNLDDLNNTLDYHINTTINPKQSFLSQLLAEQNITFIDSPTIALKSSGSMKRLKYNLNLSDINLKQNKYTLKSDNILAHGEYSVLEKDLVANIKTAIDSNVAKLKLDAKADLNLDELNNTVNYTLDTTLKPNSNFLTETLSEQNVTFIDSPTIRLKSSGSMKKLKYHLTLLDLNLKQNEYTLQSDNIISNGEYSILDRDITANIKTAINSNVAKVKLNGDTKLDLDDINSSLAFNLIANITPKKKFISSKISDNNITINSISDIDIVADGTLKRSKFKIDFKSLKAKREDIELEIRSLLISGETNPLGGKTKVNISTNIDSNVGDLRIKDRATLNFKKLKETLNHKGAIEVDANPKYLNRVLKKDKIVVITTPKIRVDIEGGIDRIGLKIDGNSDFTKDGKLFKITAKSSPLTLDLKNSRVDGTLKVKNSSKEIGFNLDSRFSGDYTNPKKLNIDANLDIKSFNSFGLNLNSLGEIKIRVKNSSKGAFVRLKSDKIELNAESPDHDQFSFYMKTDKLYLYNMMELPIELHHKFVEINLKGSALLSKEYFTLKGTINSNHDFQARVDIKNNNKGIKGVVKTEYLVAKIKGDIKERNIDASIHIKSLKELQVELNRVYEFKKFNIDGKVTVDAKVRGEKIWTKVASPLLKLNGFNIEKLELDADYNKELLSINRLNLETKGFEEKRLNRKMYLNQKGKVYLGERRSILIDMYPNILVKGEGTKENMSAKIKIVSLPLGHPDYGSMFLNCDIDYKQRGLDKRITGVIDMRKMNLFYEAKFLEADYDPDVVIVSKDNKKKKDEESDPFLKHTAIDIDIKAPEAKYRTADIDLIFDIKLKAKKYLGSPLSMLGKIEDIDGRVDKVPKRFLVKNSNIVFTGEEKINPLLDIHVEYELPQVLIHIAIGGNANRPKLEFTSEPPMPKKDIMSYLLLGVSATQIGEGEGSLSREAELFILNQAARDLAYEFELDRVFIKDDGTGEGFAIETGKKVSKKNMIIIESSKQGNSFILEHDIKKNLKLRVGQHQKEIPSQSIDIYFRKRFK
jgi:hypothetical protein